jgi:hypothetical protein
MSAKSNSSRLLEIKHSFEKVMENVSQKARYEIPHFGDFNSDAQAKEVQALKAKERGNTQERLDSVQKDITSEKRAVPRTIGKVKFPFVTSEGVHEKAIGENQLTSARILLASKPDAQTLGEEIRQGLALGRTDFAWSLIDHALSRIQKAGLALSDEERALKEGLAEILGGIEGTAKIAELETEAKAIQAVERAASDFQAQLSTGAEYIILPDLWPLLTEEERAKALEIQGGRNITDLVTMKQRIAEVMGQV